MKHKPTAGAARYRHPLTAVIIGLSILVLAGRSYGQGNIDLQALIHETQKVSQAPSQLTLVWWLPEQFWQASLGQDPNASKAQVDQLLNTIRPYTMIAVVDGRMGAFGGVTYRSEEAIRTSVTIRDAKGLSYAPLSESAIDPNMKNLLQMLRPVIVNMLGPMGQNMHFLLFQSRSKDGRLVADPTGKGILSVLFAGKEFKYRLPLGSVLPPKYDPETEERFPGNYNYNPFTGSKLVTEPSNKPLQPTR
jgi:hypothetical protein